MKCPNCGSESTGAFCAECGTPLKGARCKECNAALAIGARFCTNCGTPTTGKKAAAQSRTAWYVVGGAAVLLLAVLLWPNLTGKSKGNESDGRMPISQMPGAGVADGAAATDPLSGTPRERADRLFNRVMTEKESGDTARAKFFTPMAIQAYGAIPDLDDDGLYHLSLIHAVAGDFKAARETAEKILTKSPNHLLALSAAAGAARGAGDNAAAKKYYERFLAAFDSENKKDLPEYRDHSRMFPELKTEAETFLKAN